MRHGLVRYRDPKSGVSVSTLAFDYPADFHVEEHAHGSDQVIYATSGVMEISAGESLWMIPPQFAIWIPARTLHQIRMPGKVSMRTLYCRCGMAAQMPDACIVLHVAPLLRELIVEAVRIGDLRTRNRLHCALRDLIVRGLEGAKVVPTSVALPKDERALAAARRVIAEPGADQTLSTLCRECGVSVRTIERVFRRELGISFEAWRRQVRLMRGIELIAGGKTVKEAAFEVGYQQPSAFVQMFRKTLGVTPKAWLSALQGS